MGKTLADLQSNISISAQNAVTGDIEFCTGYTGFSSDIGEQAGWYIALKIDTSAEGSALEGATITATYHNRTVTLDSDRIIIVRLAEGEDSITFTANKEGYSEGRLTLDLSGLDKEALTQNILYTASLTNGVTVSPLQFGESKTITGQVPWNTTDNANTFNISMRPFEMVAPGTPWSIAFNGVELAEGEFSTITPNSGSPYSFATAKLAITQEMISAQSPYLVVTVRPDSGDVMDAFYSSMNIGALTLAPDPTPRINVTSDTTGVTITPATYNTSKTATGQVPYDTTDQKNVLSVALTTSGTLPTGPYTIEVFAQGDVTQQPIWYTTGASTIPQSISIPLTSNEVGTGKYITVNFSGANDSEFIIVTINTSALTLEAAPTPPSGPDFTGIMAGDYGATALFKQTANYGTYYGYIPDATNYATCLASTTELTYTGATTVSGHTQYNYTMTDELSEGKGIAYMTPTNPSNPWFGCSDWINTSDNSYVIMWPGDGIKLAGKGTGTDYDYGDNIYDAFQQNGSVYNAYMAIWNATTLGDYHYILKGYDHTTVIDIASSYMLIFALYDVTSNMSGRSIKFHLYNSTKTDYIIINIDISNVTAIQVT